MDSSQDVPAIGRDPDAFEVFYREHLPWVRQFVARRVDDRNTAADLTADIFLAAADSSGSYRPGCGRPGAWLAGVARNVVADHFRRRVREARANGRFAGRALLDEQSSERTALSLTDAAQALGIPAGTARVRYHRARTRLKNVLPSPFEVSA